MINLYGRTITVVNDQGPADPTQPLGGPAPRLEVSGIKGVFARPSGYIKLGESYFMGPGMWEECEKICLVLPSMTHDFAKFTRIVDFDSTEYKIWKVEEIRPAEIPLLLYLGLKS